MSSGTRLLRDGLAQILDLDEGISVVSSASSLEGTLAELMLHRVDVVLVDMSLPSSLSAIRAVAHAYPDSRVVAISLPDRESDVLACVEAGAAGWVAEEASLPELLDVIRTAARGEALCSPRMTAALVRRLGSMNGANGFHPRSLTARELEIVHLLDEGLSNKQIAARLSIEVATVKNHLHHVFEKLSVSGRGEAAAWLRRRAPSELPSLRRIGA